MFSSFVKSSRVQSLLSKSGRGNQSLFHKKPDFTKNAFNVTRGDFNYLQNDHIHFFKSLLGENRVVMDSSDLEKYNVDWYLQVRGNSAIVLKPKSTEEVSKILSFCNGHKLAVCPQGGNTNVVGAAVPVFDEIIISTELMNEIIELDEEAGILTCQAGCILENLDNYLSERGLIVPLDIGAKGSCHIGGNVSTNAGGMRLIRYGNMHGNILGLEVVLANGTIVDCVSALKKDNSGYHLNNLFIGSEGSLGLVTKVSLQCPSRPKFRNVAFFGLQNFDKVLETFTLSKHKLGEILSAVEVMDTPTMDFIKERNNQKSPIGDYPFYLMIETSGSNEQHDEEKLNMFFEETLEKELVLNGTVANETNKIQDIWSIRENITNGYKTCGAVFYYDISLPTDNYYTIVDEIRAHMGNSCVRVFGYGHLGDGNVHLQIQLEEYSEDLKRHVEPYIFERIAAYKGSISAEHGIGFMKAKYLKMVKPKTTLDSMKNLKIMLDPKGILNPYKILPE
nr:D-2-hydroxyglutarate dehydrogenase, mitochondrial-like [Leptinotarsa decemlineata]